MSKVPMCSIEDKGLFIFSESTKFPQSVGIRDNSQDNHWVFVPMTYRLRPCGERYSKGCPLSVVKLKRRL